MSRGVCACRVDPIQTCRIRRAAGRDVPNKLGAEGVRQSPGVYCAVVAKAISCLLEPTLSHVLPSIERGVGELPFPLPAGAVDRLDRFIAELLRWNRAYNLTAIREANQMVVQHLLDSLVVLPQISGPVADVGSGAGLPGLAWAIAQPDLAVTSIESVGKKVRFQRHLCRELGLGNVSVEQARVEHFQSDTRFATVTCRAFTSLQRFVDLTRHLIAPGGRWVAMKGQVPHEELKALDTSVTVDTILPLTVPGLDAERCAVILREAA